MDVDFPALNPAVSTAVKPNLMAAANAVATALAYRSPQTDPQPRPQPSTRRMVAEGRSDLQLTMEERLAALKPRGRVQRAVQLSADELRAFDAERKRRSRADHRDR